MARIFVYGTLRTGMYNYDQYLKDKQSFKKYGYIKGKLMSLKGQKYPAFLLEGDDMILGEIHEVDDEFIKVLDVLESYFGENNPNNEYNKIVCDIYDDNETIIEQIPVYVYNDKNESNARLLDKEIGNDFVKYFLNKS